MRCLTCSPKVKPLRTGLLTSIPVYSAEERTVRNEKSRFSEEQIVAILRESEAHKELCRKHNISDAPFYQWRSKYGGMQVSDVKRLKSLEEENIRLKRLVDRLPLPWTGEPGFEPWGNGHWPERPDTTDPGWEIPPEERGGSDTDVGGPMKPGEQN